MIKIDFLFFIFTPMYILKAIKSSINEGARKNNQKHFFLFLSVGLWILMFLSIKHSFLGFLSANLFLIGFLVGNLYLQLDITKYSERDRIFLMSKMVKLLSSVSAIALAYLLSAIPAIVYSLIAFNGNMDYSRELSIVTGYHLIAGGILFGLWLLFILFNEGNIFLSFPRSSEKVWPVELKMYGKLCIFAYNLIVVTMFISFWMEGRLLLSRL